MRKDDESCIKLKTACGPITEAKAATDNQDIPLKYANGFNQMIIDDRLVDENDFFGTSLDNAKKVIESQRILGTMGFQAQKKLVIKFVNL